MQSNEVLRIFAYAYTLKEKVRSIMKTASTKSKYLFIFMGSFTVYLGP